MKEIPLTKGMIAVVDDEDCETVSKYKWCAHKNSTSKNLYYAASHTPTVNGKRKFISMHSLILGNRKGFVIDHINGNGLDNRRKNLRFASQRQNCQNMRRKTTSRYPGVYWHKKAKKWMAQVKIQDRKIYLGLFEKEEEAFNAYVETLQKYVGTENIVVMRCS